MAVKQPDGLYRGAAVDLMHGQPGDILQFLLKGTGDLHDPLSHNGPADQTCHMHIQINEISYSFEIKYVPH